MIIPLTIDMNDTQILKMEQFLGTKLTIDDIQRIVERACEEWVNEQTPNPLLVCDNYAQLTSIDNTL